MMRNLGNANVSRTSLAWISTSVGRVLAVIARGLDRESLIA